MRFVTIKTEEQQQRLAWHRLREGWKAERTALFNRIRGLLTEFGIVVELGATKIRRKLAELESDSAYPQSIQLMAQSVREQVGVLDKRLAECERQIAQQSKSDPAVIRLRSRPGIGPLTADAIIATVGDARQFKNGRQFAASLGITPRQHGSGGKTHLGAITRRGDSYLRSLLVQGARCVLQAALRLHKNKPDTLNRLQLWMVKLNDRAGYHKAAVAIANKHARQVWAMITRGEAYNADAYKDWEAAHATVCPGDRQKACDDDLPTVALAAASV
jgi:transposase